MTQDLSSLTMPQPSPGIGKDGTGRTGLSIRREELLCASREFESYFLSYLMKVMRETVPKEALTANRMGDMFHSFYDEEIGKRAAEAGGMGFSDYVLEAIAANEDLANPPFPDPLSTKFEAVG